MEDVIRDLARAVFGKYYGKYRGFVVDNADPEHRGRLRLRVPSVIGQENSDWALPCMPFGGRAGHGLFVIPENNAQVWVEFEEGDRSRPVWTGTFWQKKEDVPEEARAPEQPTTRLFRTPSGHALRFEDEKDKERVVLRHHGGAEVTIDEKGSIGLTDQKGAMLVLDADKGEIRVEDSHGNRVLLRESGVVIEDTGGNVIETSASGIKVKGQQIVVEGTQVMLGGQGGEPVIKGTSFLSLFATHVHTVSSIGGPTTPPIPQGEASSLSTAVMAK